MNPILIAALVLGGGYVVLSGLGLGASVALPSPGVRTVTFDGHSVLVSVPKGLRRLRVVLYLHGFGGSISTIASSLLPKLNAASDPAIVIAPQLGPKSEPGTLASSGAIAKLLASVGLRPAQIDVLAHSGGYSAAAAMVARGGVVVSSVGLLDALYGELPAFAEFARSGRTRHFVNVYGPTTAANSLALAKQIGGKIDQEATSAPDVAYLRSSKAVTVATSVFHPTVPDVYGAALIDVFS